MKHLIVALALVLASCASSPSSKAPAKPKAAAAEALPAFRATDQFDKEWTEKDAAAKPLLIDFWATWCVPCLKSIPDLKAFRDKHGKKMQLLGASTDGKGWDVVKPAMARFNIDYPIVVVDTEVAQSYGVAGYPFLVLVKEGRIEKRLLGRHSLADLEEKLAPYLK